MLALFLVMAAAVPARAACGGGWLPQYERDWGYTQARWDDLCARGGDPESELKNLQSDANRACRAKYAQKLFLSDIEVYCALGWTGDVHLAQLARLPPPPPLVAPPALPAAATSGALPGAVSDDRPAPGTADMGPLMDALKRARGEWKPDACFSGLHYTYAKAKVVSTEEIERAWHERRQPQQTGWTGIEAYNYVFRSDQIYATDFRVSFGDWQADECNQFERLKGPDTGGVIPSLAPYHTCLRNATTGLAKAVAAARRGRPGANAAPDEMGADLVVLPPSFLSGSDCRFQKSSDAPERSCAGVDAKAVRRALGVEVWMVAVEGRTSFVSASDGKLIASVPGYLSIHNAPHSLVNGYGCGTRLH